MHHKVAALLGILAVLVYFFQPLPLAVNNGVCPSPLLPCFSTASSAGNGLLAVFLGVLAGVIYVWGGKLEKEA